jgi:hypothetical protein
MTTTCLPRARIRLALPWLALAAASGCASPPTTSSRALAAAPKPVKNLFVMTPPAIYHGVGPRAAPGGMDLELFAQSLITVLSIQLNEAGQHSATTLVTKPGRSLRELVAERNKSSGATEALVVATKRATFAAGMVRSVEVEARLYDAASMSVLWEYSYQTQQAPGTITLDLARDIMKSLKAGGFLA